MRKRVMALATAGVLGAGAVGAVAVVAVPAVAETATGQATPSEAVGSRVDRIRERLQGLVDDKTITDQQADKVAEKLDETGPALGRGGGRWFFGAGEDVAAAAAGALGVTEDELTKDLRAGTTLKEIAEREGKDLAAVESAIVAEIREKIDEAVADDRIPQERADELKADVPTWVQRFAEDGFPAGGWGHGPGRHWWTDRDKDGEDETPAPSPGGSGQSSDWWGNPGSAGWRGTA